MAKLDSARQKEESHSALSCWAHGYFVGYKPLSSITRGCKIAALVTDGVDASFLKTLKVALKQANAEFVIITPVVGGVQANDGRWIDADETISGGPSMLFDAIAVLVPAEGVKRVANDAAACDFIADAYAHSKFIGCMAKSAPLLERAGVPTKLDPGVVVLNSEADIIRFVQTCPTLRSRGHASRMKQAEPVQ